jgi:general secretion pathway protein J
VRRPFQFARKRPQATRPSPRVQLQSIRPRRGFTLLELLIATTLLSLLSTGIFMALRIGLGAMERSSARLTESRRLVGVHRVLEQQVAGLIPALLQCAPGAPRQALFYGEPTGVRMVTAYSLQEAGRGYPSLIEYSVAPGAGGGVRLLVTESPYTAFSPMSPFCGGIAAPQAAPRPFVLADNLAYCRFSFLIDDPVRRQRGWVRAWAPPPGSAASFPSAIRIEMEPLRTGNDAFAIRTVTVAVRAGRSPLFKYQDVDEPEVRRQETVPLPLVF